MKLNTLNKFTKNLPADPNLENTTRQVENACFSFVTPQIPSNPELVHASEELAQELGITKEDLISEDFLAVFSGKKVLQNTQPYALCYGGHQFGHWAGQLGDGRAINLTEITHQDKSYTLQLKGAGPTPYSRRADGLAVLRSSIREHLCSEAMHYLGVPTTRSLSLILSGDLVLRDVLYNGNAAYEKGAIVCRVAPSFIRFGSFQIFAARNDLENLKKLTNFTIQEHFPEIEQNSVAGYLHFFETVAIKSREMVLQWQRVGFVHGVMNTDNMSIHGLTIDYGPYGWSDDYNDNWTPNTTDNQHKRYRFGNQPEMVLWNLYQLANALFPLIQEAKPLEEILNNFQIQYEKEYQIMMFHKLGLFEKQQESNPIIDDLLSLFKESEIDMTLFFRNLCNINAKSNLDTDFEIIAYSFYDYSSVTKTTMSNWTKWLLEYKELLTIEPIENSKRIEKMNQTNPKYVLRNYMAQLCIEAADQGDYSLVHELHEVLKKPYEEQPEFEKWFARRPDWAKNKVGCSALSCSS